MDEVLAASAWVRRLPLVGAVLFAVMVLLPVTLAAAAPGSGPVSNEAPPTISGPTIESETLTTSNGEWKYPPPKAPTYFYAWLRCDAAGDSCAVIPGADQKTYQLAAADVGHRLRSRVHIRVDLSPARRVDSEPSTSAPSAVITALPPSLTERPKVSVVGGGVIRVGADLETDRGEWTSAIDFDTSVRWLRCDVEGENCTLIPGEAGDTYTLTEEDQGYSFRSQVTATNATGSASAWSAVAPSEGAFERQTVSDNIAAGGELSSGPVSAERPLQVTLNSPVAGEVSITTGSPTVVAPEGVQWMNAEAQIDAPNAPSIDNPLVLVFRYDSSIVPDGAEFLNIYRNSVELEVCQTGDIEAADSDEVVGQVQKADPCVSAKNTLPDGDVEVVVHTTHASTWTGSNNGPRYDADDPPRILNARTPSPWDGDVLDTYLGPWDTNRDGVADDLSTGHIISYQWYRCTSAAGACNTRINGATGKTYTVSLADRNRFLHVRITVRRTTGPSTTYTGAARTGRVIAAPPQNTQTPEIIPNDVAPMEGVELDSTVGEWDESHGFPISYRRQWQRSLDGVTWVDIAGATAAKYTPATGDIGYQLRVEVNAFTSLNNTGDYAYSSATEPVVAAKPRNTVPPHITGTPMEGLTLTTTNGTWTSSVPITGYTYQWQRCDAAAVCADIAGATTQSYVLDASDIDSFIQVVVSAANSGGSEPQTSDNRPGPVDPAPPVLIENPVVTGTPKEGETLQSTAGVFQSSVSLDYAYQWLRCADLTLGSCATIPGATEADYIVQDADIDSYLRSQVAASNRSGTAYGTSEPTGIALPRAPYVDGTGPVITGNTVEEQTLHVSDGTWARNPTSFAYQWLRCDLTGLNCEPIEDTTDSTTADYRLRGLDVGFTMRVDVTATNAGGSTTARTEPSAEVQPLAPVLVTRPALSGIAREGLELTSTVGAFQSSVPLDYDYQWQRCELAVAGDGEGQNCEDITGASGTVAVGETSFSYTVTAADAEFRLRSVVTARNAWGGSATGNSLPSERVRAQGPVFLGGATIDGLERHGETLTANEGTWDTWGTLAFEYQWFLCDADLDLNGDATGCAPIEGATAKTYELLGTDIDKRLRVEVKAFNEESPETKTGPVSSDPSRVVMPRVPTLDTAPVISVEDGSGNPGVYRDGNVLKVTDGVWTSTPGVTVTSYEWYRCDSAGANCELTGNASNSQPLALEDVGYRFKATVSVDNGYVDDNYVDGEPVAASTELSPEIEASVPACQGGDDSRCATIDFDTADGELHLGDVVTGHSTVAEWTNLPTSFNYQFQRCDASGAEETCVDIAGAAGTDADTSDNDLGTYTTTLDDVGSRLRVFVVAENASGESARAYSLVTDVVGPNRIAPPSAFNAAFTGTMQETRTVTAETDFVEPAGIAFDYEYQWYRCDTAAGTDNEQGDTCQPIAGATSADYALERVTDYQKFIQVKVTISNVSGALSDFSPIRGPVLAFPVICPQDGSGNYALCGEIKLDPADDPAAFEGGTLMGLHYADAWLSTPPVSNFRYTWLRCDEEGICTEVTTNPDGTAREPNDPRYTLGIPDIGFQIKLGITAQNEAGEGYYETAPTPVVQGRAPVMVGRPEIDVEEFTQGAECPDGYDLVGAPGEQRCEYIEIIPTPPRCDDGIDNEQPGDGLIDYPNDPQCSGPLDDTEADPVPVSEPVTEGEGDIDDDFRGDICNTVDGTRSNLGRSIRDSSPLAYYRFDFLAPNGGSSNGWYWDPSRKVTTTAGTYTGAWIAPWGAPYPLGNPQTGAIANYATGFAYDGKAMDAWRIAAAMGIWPQTSVKCAAATGYIDTTKPIFDGQIDDRDHASFIDSRPGANPLGIDGAANPNAEDFTVEFWLDPQFEDRGYVFTYGTAGKNGFTLRMGNGSCGVGGDLYLTIGGVTCGAIRIPEIRRDQNRRNELYGHVALVHTNNTWRLYYNGEFQGISHSIMKRPDPFYSFVNPPPLADWRNISTARIDEAALYSHALTQQEIKYRFCNAPNQVTKQYDHCATGFPAPTSGPSSSTSTTTVAPTETSVPPQTIVHTSPITARVGTRLVGSDGIWAGTPNIIINNRQWSRCSGEAPPLLGWGEEGNGDWTCAPIPGATGPSYELTAEDKNFTIRFEVVAENGYGRGPSQRDRPVGPAIATSDTYAADGIGVSRAWPTEAEPGAAVVDADAPECQSPVAFIENGNDIVQSERPVCEGFGLNYSSPQWLICDAAGSNCGSLIEGPVRISESNPDDTARVVYTVSNSYGEVTLTSAPVALSGLVPPECTLTPKVGDTIPSACAPFTLAWPDATGASAPIGDYEIQPEDEGRIVVYHVNRDGETAYVVSRAIPRVTAPFFNTDLHARPTIAGAAFPGSTVYAFWSPGAGGHDGELNPCALSGITCEWYAEMGDQAPTYSPEDGFEPQLTFLGIGSEMTVPECTTEIDPTCTPLEGQSLVLRVKYSDGIYEQSAYSDPTGLTKPTNTQLPTRPVAEPVDTAGTDTDSVGGTKPTPGKLLKGNLGTWTGSSPMSFSYQWQSSLDGEAWVDHATTATINLTNADIGKRFRYIVTANNGLTGPGTPDPDGVSAISPASDAVSAQVAPAAVGQPTVQICQRNGSCGAGSPPHASQDLQGFYSSAVFTGSLPLAGFTYTFAWERTIDGGTTWETVGTDSRYQMNSSDIGYSFRFALTATNDAGSATAYSNLTAAVVAIPVENTTAPSITIARGFTQNGSPITTDVDGNPLAHPEPGFTLIADRGSWTGSPTINYSYQWQTSTDGVSWVDAGSASPAATRGVVAGDVGKMFRVVVTAANASSSASAQSDATAAVEAAPPVLISAPTLSGQVIEGQTLTTSNGTWRSNAPLTFTYQWRRCDEGGLNCVDLAGQTQNTYTLTALDIGQTLVARVTASNASDALSEETLASARAFAKAPVVIEPPSISTNSATPGDTLTTDGGSYSSSVPFNVTLQWQRLVGLDWVDIEGATDSSYVVQIADIDYELRVKANAKNTDLGELDTDAFSGRTAVGDANTYRSAAFADGADVYWRLDETYPAADGLRMNDTIGANHGTFTRGTLFCNSCFTTTRPQPPVTVGHTDANQAVVAGNVTAEFNGGGSGDATIAASTLTAGAGTATTVELWMKWNGAFPTQFGAAGPMVIFSLGSATVSNGYHVVLEPNGRFGFGAASGSITSPVIWGTNVDLDTFDDTWHHVVMEFNSGAINQSKLYVDGQPLALSQMPGNGLYNTDTFNIPDTGNLKTRVSGTVVNGGCYTSCNTDTGGNGTWVFGRLDEVALYKGALTPTQVARHYQLAFPDAVVPVLRDAQNVPSISGSTIEGETLVANEGRWTGTRPLSFNYQWQSCNAGGGSCTNITGATAKTFTITANEVDRSLRVVVSAANVAGTSDPYTTAATSPVLLNQNTGAPVVSIVGGSDPVAEGQQLTTTNGGWSSAPTNYSYQWQKSTDGSTWANLPGANASVHSLVFGDAGARFRVKVYAYSGPATLGVGISAPTDVVVSSRPVNQVAPVLSGTPQTGQPLAVSSGSWTGSPYGFRYQWQSSVDGVTWVDIDGASSNFLPLESHSGLHLRARVIAYAKVGVENVASAPVLSNATGPLSSSVPVLIGSLDLSGTAKEGQALTVRGANDATTASDSVGANTGTYNGSYVTGQASPVGGFGLQLINAGTAGSVTVKSNGPIIGDAGDFSVAAWVNTKDSLAGTTPERILYSEGKTSSPFQHFFLATNAGRPMFRWRPDTAAQVDIIATNSIADGAWHHLAVTKSGDTVTLYVDGQPVQTAQAPGAVSWGTTGFNSWVGTNAAYGGRNWNGLVDEVSVYRSALSAASVAAHYNAADYPSEVTGNSPASYWRFEDGVRWNNAPTAYQYQWQRSDDGENWSDVSGASSSTYIPQATDIGAQFRASVRARTVVSGVTITSASYLSPASGVVTGGRPEVVTAPVLSGTPAVGQLLSVSTGSWSNSPVTYRYQWQRSDDGTFWSDIDGATDNTHMVQAADADKQLRANVIAYSRVDSRALPATAPAGSNAVSVPALVSGTNYSGAVAGTSGLQAYWRFGEASGTTATDSSGNGRNATYIGSPTLSAGGALFGDPDTAVSLSGTSQYATAAPISLNRYTIETWFRPDGNQGVSGQAPAIVSTTYPSTVNYTIAFVGGTRNVYAGFFNGAWHETGRVTLPDQQWSHLVTTYDGATLRLYVNGAEATPKAVVANPSTTGANFLIGKRWDFNEYVKGTLDDMSVYNRALSASEVQAHMTAGGATPSTATSAPVLTAGAAITGRLNGVTPVIGSELVADPGSWSGGVKKYTYRWERFSGSLVAEVKAESTDPTYTPTAADAGYFLRVYVAAENDLGKTTTTAHTQVTNGSVSTFAPLLTVIPQIQGRLNNLNPVIGQTLTATSGTWDANRGFRNITYRWERFAGSSVIEVKAASTDPTYTPTTADAGWSLRVFVTAQNELGQTTTNVTTGSATVVSYNPTLTVAPTIQGLNNGVPLVGQTLVASSGTWDISRGAQKYTYRWERFAGSSVVPLTSDSTDPSYTVQATDAGWFLRVFVTAYNASGSTTTSVHTQPNAVAAGGPGFISAPAIQGTVKVGNVLSASVGSWSGSPTSYEFTWQNNNTGATLGTGPTFTPASAHAGINLRVRVVPSNVLGSVGGATSGATAIAP